MKKRNRAERFVLSDSVRFGEPSSQCNFTATRPPLFNGNEGVHDAIYRSVFASVEPTKMVILDRRASSYQNADSKGNLKLFTEALTDVLKDMKKGVKNDDINYLLANNGEELINKIGKHYCLSAEQIKAVKEELNKSEKLEKKDVSVSSNTDARILATS
jgi:ATP-dependent Lon protease